MASDTTDPAADLPAPRADGRRARGDRTRHDVARQAAMSATVHGLDAITVGALAARTGHSKSGILTVFANREAIQIAAVAEARTLYLRHVVEPSWPAAPGAPRLRALLDNWVAYLRDGVFPGGCFITATSVEYGRREGPVADAVRGLAREWLDLLEAELSAAGSDSPTDDAFRIDAYLRAANTRYQLFGDEVELERARRLSLDVLGA
ncbi:TetR/AcrR family transcriptional regulator [Yinghuangia seranimata]|uniref:TetR/AcrR family transcriptional regulator n=1 Tax=Yinghuangia seranimata TaxID=408067 RepID=UPI00248AE642|nr:TetR/AcrR family transcriptional regulator [Yinghuangia seranimata]MDI2127547.1 TetR/AcrR family transcriptional regulator [Yinghuangia seranimata]